MILTEHRGIDDSPRTPQEVDFPVCTRSSRSSGLFPQDSCASPHGRGFHLTRERVEIAEVPADRVGSQSRCLARAVSSSTENPYLFPADLFRMAQRQSHDDHSINRECAVNQS